MSDVVARLFGLFLVVCSVGALYAEVAIDETPLACLKIPGTLAPGLIFLYLGDPTNGTSVVYAELEPDVGFGHADIDLIANAPSDLAYLLKRLAAWEDIGRMISQADNITDLGEYSDQMRVVTNEVRKLLKESKK